MPKISVVIASYNHERYVAQTLESVLGQTYQDFEIVITDDGSADRTVETIRSFRDPRIRLFCFEENRGASAAMNHCIREAKGEYIAALASDDLCAPERLEKQAAILDRSPQIGAVFSYAQIIDEDGVSFADTNHRYYKIFKQPNRSRHEWLRHFFYHGNALCHPSLMIRRKCHEEADVGYYDERLAQLLDLDMWIRLCQRHEIYIISEDLVKYRVRAGDVSASGSRPETRRRLVAEHTRILNNFLKIKSADAVYRIFPETKKYGDDLHESVLPFLISMLALKRKSIAHQNFAISTLFELLKDQQTRDRLFEVFGFSPIDFIELTGKYDLFNIDVNHLLQQKDQEVRRLETALHTKQQELEKIHASFAWRIVKRCRKIINRTIPVYTRRRRLYFQIDSGVKIIINDGWTEFFKKVRDKVYAKFWPYKVWRSRNEPSGDQLSTTKAEIGSLSYRPLVSIVIPVFNPSRFALTQCIQSVLDQIYENWELCIVDGGSDQAHVTEVIQRFLSSDPRIKYAVLDKNRGIAGNSNEALKLATGEYVGFLDHDDTLAPFALYEVVKLLNQDLSIDFIFSDEDKVPAFGAKRYDPEFKSDWAPDTFLSYNYLCHFAVVRKKIVDDVGGFREGYDGAQDYDLILRVVEKTKAIKRIPKVLYHWRAAGTSTASGVKVKPYAISAAKKAIAEHVSRRGLDAEVQDGLALGTYRVKYRLRPRQKVCIIIPTKDKVRLLKQCVSSVLEKASYGHFKIIIVDNQSEEKETFDFFHSIKNEERITVLPYNHPFNFSAINNYAVRSDDSEYLLFLNNDTEVINADWLGAMLEFAQREDVGAVGAKLYYPSNRIQHAGTIIGYYGVADHAHKHFPRSARGYMGRINVIQDLSAVTAACMMVRRTVFEEVGGYDEELSHSFNDVDLCLKIRDRGYLIVYTPYAELYHHESVSRGYDDKPEQKSRLDKEIELVKTRWKHVFEAGDPYYSPNLTLEKTDFSIRI